jgi:translation initiation factor IF-3
MRKNQPQQNKDFVRCNERIRIPEVRVIYDGKNLGIMSSRDALLKAQELGLDLVEVSPNVRPPVCQIMDYGKFMYEKSKRKKDQKGSSKKEKEIAFRYVIDKHDLETKAGQARKFIEKDYRVKLVVKFKAREKAHKDQGFKAIKDLIALLEDVAEVEKEPGFEGHTVTARLDKRKGKKSSEKGSSSIQDPKDKPNEAKSNT